MNVQRQVDSFIQEAVSTMEKLPGKPRSWDRLVSEKIEERKSRVMRNGKKLCIGILAAVMGLSCMLPGTALAAAGEGSATGAALYSPAFNAPEGTYVPGEVILCVREAEMDDRKIISRSFDAKGRRLFGEKPEVTLKDLMDVSHAAADFENEEKGIDTEGLVATGAVPEKTTLKAVHSDTLSTEELIGLYNGQPGVVFAEPNYILQLEETEEPKAPKETQESRRIFEGAYAEADSLLPAGTDSQTIPDLTGFQYAYGNGDGGIDVPDWNNKNKLNAEGVIVAVVDSGVDYTNPDLQAAMWDEGLNFPELTSLGGGKYGANFGYEYWSDDPAYNTDPDDPMDTQGHGTHCAGIIGAEWNDFGVSGAAGGARIMALKCAANNSGGMSSFAIIRSFNYILTARKAGVNVKVVNCSFGNPRIAYSQAYAVKELGDADVVTVFASGNSNFDLDMEVDTVNGLREIPSNINVNSNTEDGDKSNFSNYSLRNTDLFAPGTKIMSSFPNSRKTVIPDENISEPVKTASHKPAYDDYSTTDTFFTYEANTAVGAELSFDTDEKLLRVQHTDLEKYEDEITRETLGEAAAPGYVVPLTIQANEPIPRPTDESKLFLVEGGLSERSNYYAKVFIKTVDGGWERPDVTNVLTKKEGFNVYPLEKGMNGGEFDLEHLEIRIAVHDIEYGKQDSASTDFALTRIWITDAPAFPFKFLDGTSMATPAVTGEVAVLAKAFPGDSADKLAARVLAGAEKGPNGNFEGLCVTGGMANVRNSLNEDTYTPVINSLSVDEEGLHIRGYFFGTKENTTVRLAQGNNIWSAGDGDGLSALSIVGIRKDPEDPDHQEILLPVPENLRGGREVFVTVENAEKEASRRTASRYLTLSDPDGYTETVYRAVSLPKAQYEEFSGMEETEIVALGGELYFPGVYHEDPAYYSTWRYDGRTLSKLAVPVIPISNIITWNRCMVYFSSENEMNLTFHNGTEVVRSLPFCPIKEEVSGEDAWIMESPDRDDYCILYYDGSDLLLLRSNSAQPAGEGNAVYRVDPFTAMGEYLGKLNHRIDCDTVISHRESGSAGASSNTIYVFGSDSAKRGEGVYLESFTVDGFAPESLSLPALPEELVTRESGNLIEWRGCSVKDGMLFVGPYIRGNGKESPENELVSSDNFYLDLAHIEDGIRPLHRKITEPRIYNPKVVCGNGKVWFMGKRSGGYFLAQTDADTYPAYGDEAAFGDNPGDVTDVSVKTRRLSLSAKALTLEAENVPFALSAKRVFQDAGKQTGVYFTSSNPKILRVDPVGNGNGQTSLWPVRSGTARIFAWCGNKKTSCRVKIEKRYHKDDIDICSAITNEETGRIDYPMCDSLEMTSGEKVGLFAQSNDGSPYGTGREKITWKSSNEKVAVVDNGLVSAKAAGKARITLSWSLDKEKFTKTCEVTVTNAKAVPKAISRDKAVKLKVQAPKKVVIGEEAAQEIVVTLNGEGASDRRVKLISSNPAVLTLGEEGAEELTLTPEESDGVFAARAVVNPVAPGEASIIVESGPDLAANDKLNREICKVAVSAELEQILVMYDTWKYLRLVNGELILIMRPGETTSLLNIPFPLNSDVVTKMKWSARGRTATVKNGVVTAKKVKLDEETGQPVPTVIICRIGDRTVEYKVYVR